MTLVVSRAASKDWNFMEHSVLDTTVDSDGGLLDAEVNAYPYRLTVDA